LKKTALTGGFSRFQGISGIVAIASDRIEFGDRATQKRAIVRDRRRISRGGRPIMPYRTIQWNYE